VGKRTKRFKGKRTKRFKGATITWDPIQLILSTSGVTLLTYATGDLNVGRWVLIWLALFLYTVELEWKSRDGLDDRRPQGNSP
jgi:hypothetical protein